MKLVGMKDSAFEKDGKKFYGKVLFFVYEDKHTDGHATDRVWISDQRLNERAKGSLVIGEYYEVYYNKYGKVSGIGEG